MDEEKFKEIVYEKTQELKELRQHLRVKEEQILGLRNKVVNLERQVFQKSQTIIQLKQKKAELSEDVFIAYEQRARLLVYFTIFLPSIIKYDLDAINPDFAYILYIVLPTGQISFHVWVGHLDFFKHVPMQGYDGKFLRFEEEALAVGTANLVWDNHTDEEKWKRFSRYCSSHPDLGDLGDEVDTERSDWYPSLAQGGKIIGEEG